MPIATALRRAFAKGYGLPELRADVLAGTVVGVVALPLSMALSIAVGAPPQHGLYTAMIAGAVVALLGGCKFQVTGPTAAFVVILAPILARHGLAGLLTAGFMAGALLVAMGLVRLGRLMQFIPHPVTTGFTTGIATVIATLQLKDAFGLSVASMPEHFVDKLGALWQARGSFQPSELAVAAATLALLFGVPRVTKKVPAPLVAIALVSLAVLGIRHFVPTFSVATIGSRFQTSVDGVMLHGIPPLLPSPALPWGDGLSLGLLRELLPSAFAIALLGAIESLLSATIADGMTGTKHDPNAELVGLGIGNLLAPLFGGIAATGALARTATNIRAGARSPIAALTHAAVILLAILFLAPWVAHVPMAALAGLLLLVAWNMSEVHGFVGVLRIAPKSDVFVLLSCYALTVFFDMVIAVSVGVVLAALLFMRRMAELTETRSLLGDGAESPVVPLPPGVLLYEISGPLFFGAAQNAMGALVAARSDDYRVMILNLGKVPVIDSTGLVALDNTIGALVRRRHAVVLAGPLPRPRRVFDRAKLTKKHVGLHIAESLDSAIALAAELVAERERRPGPSSFANAQRGSA
ncbi:MAG TPA: C4-dicarboxylic acid transporter DauA [Polyangiaceae bacterium]|nr:C4-dicarboxylic acid transporter DauA [Polyangiaceae bacterium]